METTPQTVREALAKLWELPPIPVERRLAALERFWQQVCLVPPLEIGQFPWAQVQRGIEALARSAPHCSEPENIEKPGVLALILAGNTPLLAWPVLHYSVLLGIPVFIKQSRDETVWTRHFVETLAGIDPEVAAFLHLDFFPGEDPRTQTLVQNADAVIAYGNDETMVALREATPETTPFQGFGHATSVGLWTGKDAFTEFNDSLILTVASSFGVGLDCLTYSQAGCLSLQALFVENSCLEYLIEFLKDDGMPRATEALGVLMPSKIGEILRIREARDLAFMGGCEVIGDPELRWTIIVHKESCVLPKPTGFGVLHLIPLGDLAVFGEFLGLAKGRLSSIGVSGELSKELRVAIEAEGVSRICRAGEMQTPPLDWRNGGVDLQAWLAKSLTS
ncbi:MAG: hypothetical protein NTX57_02990 [Armatimonadetes bacterium]|nr:hypothetical protein [Armatimonadota bacterium]